MNTQQIYDKYQIPLNLQQHMLRVASLSQILVENRKDNNLDGPSITRACLFHDMANIIKFDFTKPLLFNDDDRNVEQWKKVQAEIITKYGNNIHSATLKICREFGLSENVLQIIENLDWNNTLKILKAGETESALAIYCDMRIGPHGILLLKNRIDDLQKRNLNHDLTFIRNVANLLEETLQKEILIDINSINNYQLNCRFEKLLHLEI